MSRNRAWGVLTAVALLVVGCRGPTQEERDNRRLLDALLTAITIKNSRLLQNEARRLEQRHKAGQLTEEQYEGMKAFIDKARAGDWTGAEKDGYEFRKKFPFVREGH
jgi:hypothetical protein